MLPSSFAIVVVGPWYVLRVGVYPFSAVRRALPRLPHEEQSINTRRCQADRCDRRAQSGLVRELLAGAPLGHVGLAGRVVAACLKASASI